MKLVTVATDSQGYFPWLQESCKRHGIPLEVLGWGEKWKGFGWKFELMKEYLQTVPPTELVCFIDAYDVILLKSPKDIEDTYRHLSRRYNKPIIVGTEKHKRILIWLFGLYIFGTCQNNKLLNSGTYIGPAKDLLEVMEYIQTHITDDPASDDQQTLSKYCNLHPEKFHLDEDAELFLTVCDIIPVQYTNPHLTIKNQTLTYKNRQPAFLHANGNTHIEDILEKLGYEITTKQRETIKQYQYRAWVRKFPHYAKFFLPLVVILLIILVFYTLSHKS